jgi:subtilase family serine protease
MTENTVRVRRIHTARSACSRPARLLTLPLLLSAALAAQCAGSAGSPAAASARDADARAAAPASADVAAVSGSAAGKTWVTTVPTGPPPSDIVANCVVSQPQQCLTPHVLREAYGFQPLLDRGIDGRGETITVISSVKLCPDQSPGTSAQPAGSDPPFPPDVTDIRQDLSAYDGEYGLPAARIEVVTALAGSASPWETTDEEAGEFELLHALVPAATLRVILFPCDVLNTTANATSDTIAALRLAVSRTDVASFNFAVGEHNFTAAQVTQIHSILRWAAAHHVTVDGSSGDTGASGAEWPITDPFVKEVSLPASDPLVLGVGGTLLTANLSTGAYISETALPGSGGGFSNRYAPPAYQEGVPGISATRGVPDVSAAAFGIPFWATADGKTYAIAVGGTSGSAPIWGALVAMTDQYTHHDLGFVNPAIYRIARSPAYHQAFHDVTTGNNTLSFNGVTIPGYQAGPGWDPVTGWGSPDAQVLVPLLAGRPWPGRSS